MSIVTAWLAYAGFRIALLPFQLSSIRFARKLGAAIGLVVYWIAPVRKKLVAQNIACFFPDWDPARRQRLVRDAYRNLGIAIADFAVGSRFRPENVDEFIKLEGGEHYKAAHAHGGQVILFGAHLAMWEWAQCVRHWCDGDAVYCIGKRIHNRFIDDYVKRKRRVFGVEMISHRGAIASLAALGKSDPTANFAFFVDQRGAKGKGVWIEVAGRPVSAMPGPAIMALRGKLQLIPSRFIRTDFGMILRFHAPIVYAATGDEGVDIQRLTQLVNDHVTAWIREQPESYFWLHDRFNVHPAEREAAEAFARTIAPTPPGPVLLPAD
jgi:KDO2-lipid IV(A) lauroyltransferase